jgi:hypothetical protein
MSSSKPPFSARHRTNHKQIDGRFPDDARAALIHLLYDLVERQFVKGWALLAREAHRIGRLPPKIYDLQHIPSINEARSDTEAAVITLRWDRVYDFCERLYNHLPSAVSQQDQYDEIEEKTRSEVQDYIEDELQRIFLEEDLAYEFSNGIAKRRGRKHTVEMTSRANVVLGDDRLQSARRHFNKAQKFFRDAKSPDFENCVKEAVCAVEAAGIALFAEAKAKTLGDLVKWLVNSKQPPLPRALGSSISAIYAYRNGGDGVGHGGSKGGEATPFVAEYVLSSAAAQIIYLVDVVNEDEPDIPI